MTAAHLDFETRSRLDISEVGAWKYSEHPSTEVLCAAYCIEDGPVKLWRPFDDLPVDLFNYASAGGTIVAHNAFFEQCVWRNTCTRNGWPVPPPPEQWRCTAAKAAAHALPRSLGAVGEALALSVQKDDAGKRVMLKLAQPRRETLKDDSPWHHSAEDYKILYDYCRTDVESERELDSKLRNLSDTEQANWVIDQHINARGIYVDKELLNAALTVHEMYLKELLLELDMHTEGKVRSVSEVAEMAKWFRDNGCDVSGVSAEEVDRALGLVLSPKIRRVLEIRRFGGKSSTAKYVSLARSLCDDGRVRDLFMFHGARTGRWSGKLVQMHNLPRGRIKDMDLAVDLLKQQNLTEIKTLGDPMEVLSGLIRGAFISAPGKDFLVADYAAIEARVLFWLSEDPVGMQVFAEGKDIYKDMSCSIYDVPLEAVTKEQRQLGKQVILGCGYSMSGAKFYVTCMKQGITITEEQAILLVKKYRERYRGIPNYWYGQERSAIQAVETGQPVKYGKVTWFKKDDFLFCKLPSGRRLAYPYPKIVQGKTPWGEMRAQLSYMTSVGASRSWQQETTYGGRLVENITQAVARDLLMNGIKNCEEANYPVVLHVHDEIVSEVPEGFGSVGEFVELITTLPDWAAGCPIAAEGWRGKRYRK